ncbi:MAG: hypothetical protein ACLGG7_03235 [Bacteriovoracia bacterium]
MKVLVALLMLSFSVVALAQLTVVPGTSDIEARPGEIKKIKIVAADSAAKERVTAKELQSLGDADTFLFSGLRDWKLENSKWIIDGSIVFTKSDVTKAPMSMGFSTGPLEVRFAGWKWVPDPNQVSPDFTYEDIPMFSRSWWIRNWPISLGLCVVLVLIGFRGSHSWRLQRNKKRQRKIMLEQMRREVSEASSISELSLIWEKRDIYRATFENEMQELEDFFKTLNQVQFKPQFSSADLEAVLVVKARLEHKLGEAKNGV